jgi:type II secretory pathway component GspD/PulD (secretin)
MSGKRRARLAVGPRVRQGVLLALLAVVAAGCAAGQAFGRGEDAARAGDWDAAVEFYRQAVLETPDRAEYQIALERAMRSASYEHLDTARLFEGQGRLEDALREYRRASEYDPPNRQVAAKVLEIEQRIRDAYEAAQPPSSLAQLRTQAQQARALPLLDPASDEPLTLAYTNASLRDVLVSMGEAAGISVSFEADVQDAPYSVSLTGVSFEQALAQILEVNGLFHKVINAQAILVIPDTVPKRTQYEEQVIQTFYLSHADATELAQMINTVVRVPAMAVQPQIAANPSSNTITVRGTANVVSIIERMIDTNDTPRAEVIIDVQILEVNRSRARQLGLDLSDFAISSTFSPSADPNAGNGTAPAFNLSAITRGISTADFYLSVPSAVVNFLETDSQTRLIAKPQLRGAEGQEITLALGDEIPVPTTVFTPLAQGGANFNPLTSFEYRPVGVNIRMLPRVTYDGEVILDLTIENSTLGQDVNVAGQNLPSFGSREVNTRIRLRDGESNLLAGLLREDERRSMRGIPGLTRIPILNRLFGGEDSLVSQTDIVMLLTPRIVRTHELTVDDVGPIFIGTSQNMELSAPPSSIIPPSAPPAEVVAPTPDGAAAEPVPGAPDAGADGEVLLSLPAVDFVAGGGPYTAPITLSGADRVGALSLTLTYNPSVLRVRGIQEGTFMRAGGVDAAFTPQLDATAGRIDIAAVRPGDTSGAAGTGMVAAVLFEAIAPGPIDLRITGMGSAPDGEDLALRFASVPAVTVP